MVAHNMYVLVIKNMLIILNMTAPIHFKVEIPSTE